MERLLQDIKHIEQLFNPRRSQMTIQIKALQEEVHTLKVNLLDKQKSYEPPCEKHIYPRSTKPWPLESFKD
jgi:hypothetical protein